MSDILTLVIDENRFLVDKKKIIEKSRYFESLFSYDFSDSKENVHTVNYKVTPCVVQDFCNWIDEDYSKSVDESYRIKMSLQKYLSDNFDSLKELLQLSVIYTVDDLSLELSDIIIQHWLKPELIIEIWKLSQELSLSTLKDVTFTVCLERFMEIPVDDLMNLLIIDFLFLLSNINIVSYKNYLEWVITGRIEKENSSGNGTKDDMKAQLLKLHEVNKCTDRKPKLMHCFFAETTKSENQGDFITRVVYAFHEESPAKFGELIELWRMEESRTDLVGMGVVGRGFSIYKIGGELRLGSCKFNMNIWRYCLLSKKWYYIARLRKTRRHMAVALVDDKLILIGGVGRYRLKLSSVEVFNLHTGCWINSPDVPETFTDFPPVCVINGLVAICVSSIYMFNPSTNKWITVAHSFDYGEIAGINCLAAYKNTLYLGKRGLFVGYEVIWDDNNTNGDINSIQGCTLVRSENKQFKSPCEKIMVLDDGKIIGIVYGFEKIMVECGYLTDSENGFDSKIHSFLPPSSCINPVNCFSLIDPTTLYKKIV